LLFWTGQVGPGAVLPAGLIGALVAAFGGLPWGPGGTQIGLPGAVGPALLTVWLPLVLALALTVSLLRAVLAEKNLPVSA
jgi:hypothetical protein